MGSKVLIRSEKFQAYIKEGALELVTLLQSSEGEEFPIGSLLTWNVEYPELQISLYREDKLYYTSPDLTASHYGLEDFCLE